MNAGKRIFVTTFVVATVWLAAFAQETGEKKSEGGKRVMRFKADDVVMLQEIGVLIASEKGSIKVRMVPSKDQRPAGMPEIDLASGDEVGMVNGRRIKVLKELKEAYDQTSIGGEIKLGVRRDGTAHIITFVKKDEKDMPHSQQMIVRRGGPDENSDFFPALGIGIAKKGKEIVISETLPDAPREMSKGDVVKSLNGKSIASIGDFNKEFDATRIGETLTFVLLRDGKEVTVSVPRPEPKQQIIRQMRTK